jgi:hypothetical protein
MQSYIKAAAIASVAVSLHGCGDSDQKPKPERKLDFLAPETYNGLEKSAKQQMIKLYQSLQLNKAAGPAVAAFLRHVPKDHHKVVDAYKKAIEEQVHAAGGSADQAVSDGVAQLHSILKSYDVGSWDKSAKDAFHKAMDNAENVVTNALASNKNEIAKYAGNVEDAIKQLTNDNVNVHVKDKVGSAITMLQGLVSQAQGYKLDAENYVDAINIQGHLTDAGLNGQGVKANEKMLHDVIKQGMTAVTKGLDVADKEAERLMNERDSLIKQAQKTTDGAVASLDKNVKKALA